MDRNLRASEKPGRRLLITGGVVLLTFLVASAYYFTTIRNTQIVQMSELRIATVKRDLFRDTLPLRATVIPLDSVFIDASQAGYVSDILVRDGQIVARGDMIANLVNNELEREIVGQHSALAGRTVDLQQQLYQIDASLSAGERNLIDAEYDLRVAEREARRQTLLFEQDVISQAGLQNAQDELAFRQKVFDTMQTSFATEKSTFALQKQEVRQAIETLADVRDSIQTLEQSLLLYAPASGRLTSFDLQIGQSISLGDRIGQLDSENSYKLRAEVDEFYINAIELGQIATARIGSDTKQVKITKILSQVNNGKFLIELEFDTQPTAGLRRGQTLDLTLELIEPEPALLIPTGAYIDSTGANWVYVVDKDGRAMRRDIVVAKRSISQISVSRGLSDGEHIIISPYTGLSENRELIVWGYQ